MNRGPCVCGCLWEAHDRWTEGTYCALCGEATCGRYRRADAWWRRWFR